MNIDFDRDGAKSTKSKEKSFFDGRTTDRIDTCTINNEDNRTRTPMTPEEFQSPC